MDQSTIETDLIEQDAINFSLVHYSDTIIDETGNPILADTIRSNASTIRHPHSNTHKSVAGVATEENENEQLRQILNSLLPPVQESSNVDAYKQVSSRAPTREDVINLQRIWDGQLQERQARETGICAIREHLNSQAFDELIRQMTINLPERGLLAVRVRDEAKMTIDTYQTLYHSSLAFGMRKCVEVR